MYRMLLNKVFICSPHFCALLFSAQNQVKPCWSDVSLHHHAAAELHVGLRAGGRAQAPHGRLGHDGERALCRRLGLLLQADVGVRVGLLADVQTSLEEVSSGGHGGQRGRVAGRGGRGAAGGGGGFQGLFPGAVLQGHRGLLRRQGGGSKHCCRWRRGRLLLGQEEQGVLGRCGLSGLDLRLGLVLDL